MMLMRDRIKIAYIPDAMVYDEKVQKPNVFMVQRARWLSSQLTFARLNLIPGFIEFFRNRNFDFLDKVIQQFLPPRIFLLGFLVIISFLSAIFNPLSYTYAWIVLTGVSITTLLMSMPGRFYDLNTLKAVLLLPTGFFMMLLSLTRIYKAKKKWGHTAHGIIQQ